jgi:hypothetical protein
MTRAQPLLDN